MSSPVRRLRDWAADGEAHVAFRQPSDGCGLAVADTVERYHVTLSTPDPVSPVPADASAFRFPVDRAVAVETGRIDLPDLLPVYVRDDDGVLVAEAIHETPLSLDPGRYLLDVEGPVKLYLRVDGPVAVDLEGDRTTLSFGGERRVVVGARSHHTRPAGTVTTTMAPADLMAAVSSFGSALKATGPERAWPTLRGHPPAVEVGDELDVPAGLDLPDAGVRVEVPREPAHVLAVAPLSYYLGATVEPGEPPGLVADDGFEHPLPDGLRAFELAVERVLERVLLFDCVVRTEGLSPIELHERPAVEDRLDADLGTLYDESPGRRLAAYLDVPHDAVADLVPTWRLAAHVDPTPDGVEALPYLAADLAAVRAPRERDPAGSDAWRAIADGFLADDATATAPGADRFVFPAARDALEQAWVGDGVPVGASEHVPAGYRNGLDREPTAGDIEVTVVCTDAGATAEWTAVQDVYGSREALPFEVTVHREPTVDDLADVLATRADFLHLVGHVDPGGVACADGKLDAATLDAVGVDAFLLNACRSYAQGRALVEAGAVGGIVTLGDVVEANAVRLGYDLGRLLNRGFPPGVALEVVREGTPVGAKYLAIGDTGLAIAQAESGTPHLLRVERDGPGFEVVGRAYPTRSHGTGLGSTVVPRYGDDRERHHLAGGRLPPMEMSGDELLESLALEDAPVLLDGELRWSDDLRDGGLPSPPDRSQGS